ncbi:alpha/beta hydrolase [Chitinophaga lutea]
MKSDIIVKDYATDPAIEQGVKTFLKALNSGGGKPMEEMTPAEARKVLEGAQTSVKADESGIDVTEKTIEQDGLSVKIFIVRPAGEKGVLPAFMFFHGGGWVLGDFPTHKRLVRDLVIYSGAAAVFVEYTRSPESHFPVSINECYAATKWVAANGASVQIDGQRLAVCGNSVGGYTTAVVALMAKEKGGPDLRLQLLLWPVTNAGFDTESYQQFAVDRFLTKNMMVWFWNQYLGGNKDLNNHLISPLRSSTGQLNGLPPAVVMTAENDVLRDEGEQYARKLDEAGVPTTAVRVLGQIHDWGLLNPLAHLPSVQETLAFAGAALKKALV